MHVIGCDEIKFSATRYNKKGNLVITAHHTTTQAQLNSVADDIKQYIEQTSDTHGIPATHPFTARANVKWSKILINSVPVGITKDRGPYTPEECHRSLIAHNPSYASFTITQKPSWVRPPSSLKLDTHSSFIVAFEDPDGNARRILLTSKQLYLLGTRAKVTRWKELKHNQPKQTTPSRSPTPTNSVLESRSNTPEAVWKLIGSTSRPRTPDAVEEMLSPTYSAPTSSVRPPKQSTPPKPQRPLRSRKTKA
jgi:hypothetical protein